jgi:Flp pilus assembly protein TadD
MNSSMMRGVRRSLLLLATGTIMAGAAAAGAQVPPPPGAAMQPLAPDHGAELRGYLTALAANPQSLGALLGAGRAALEMGDANAALTFFGRADEISPRNARVKAGMASALVQVGQPQAALQLFAEAAALGAPDVELAADRGLAYDMIGDPRRAQQNYVAALRRHENPELRRRLALSLAISGQREAALHAIDAQLRRNDRAAWRTQAFILALTGDFAGASRTAHSVMPAGSAQQMAPFLARLHGLSPADKAMAVHLGRFPSASRSGTGAAPVDVSADPAAIALVMGGAPAAAAPRTHIAAAEPRSTAPRRRPEEIRDSSDPHGLRSSRRSNRRLAPPVTRSQPSATRAEPPEPRSDVAEVVTRWAGAPYRQQPAPPVQQPQAPVSMPSPALAPPQSPSPAPAADSSATVSSAFSLPGEKVELRPPPVAPDIPSAPASGISSSMVTESAVPPESPPLPAQSEPASLLTSPPTSPAPAAGISALADIAALVNALPQEQRRAAPSSPPPQRTEPARTAQVRAAEPRPARTRATPPARPANPSRHWVQLATGPNLSLLPREFARLRTKAPEQLGRRNAYTVPLRATNRLLVGPFASAREAQEFVNQLSRRSVSAFAWTSTAGQEIDRLQTR